MKIVPITLKIAKDFISEHHRHNNPPVGWKFGVGLVDDGYIIGVATAGRPIARHFDDGFTLEINRTCTNGTKNANSMLYGACRRIARAMGYERIITYTQCDELGASLRASGFVCVRKMNPRKSWRDSSVKYVGNRCVDGNGGVARLLWQIKFKGSS